MAPRGRWDSVSQSVVHKGKGKKVQHTEERAAEDFSTASLPGPSNQGNNDADVDPAYTHSLVQARATFLTNPHGHSLLAPNLPDVEENSSSTFNFVASTCC